PTCSWASARDRVMRTTVHNRDAQVLRYVNPGCRCRDIAVYVGQLEGNGVDPTVGAILAFGTHLHRFAIGGNHDVVKRVARPGTILGLVACYLLDNHVADADRITVVAYGRHEVRNVEGVIHVVGRPQYRSLAVGSDRWRFVVVDRHSK